MGFERIEKIISDQYERKLAELNQDKENIQAATIITYDIMQASKKGGIKVEPLRFDGIFLCIPGVVNVYIKPYNYMVSSELGRNELYDTDDLERTLKQILGME